MKLREISELLNAKVRCGEDRLDEDHETAFASDLMSDVLTLGDYNPVILTGLCNMQTIRTCEMGNLDIIVLVRRKKATEEMIEEAEDEGMVVMESDFSMFKACGWYYRSGYGNTSEHFSKVPIKVGRSLPVGLLIWLLAIVALVAMPGMVWYCAKKNRRLLLLAVLPASAFALTAVVAVIALAAYGTTPTLRVQSTTILDPASRLAVTRGQFAVFAPGQVSRKMSIPSDASFCLRSRDGIVDQLSVDYAESCRLEGNWVKPLSAAFFDFERAERRSERLDVKRGADGSITVANLLGSSIVEGFIQLGGMRYRVPPLAPGAEAAVSEKVPSVETSPSTTPAEALAERLFSASTNYGRRWSSTIEIASNTKTPLPDGTYIVRMVGSPFFPSPLAGTKAYETMESVVAGCIAAEAGKEAAK